MKSHRTGIAGRKSTARASILGMAILITLATAAAIVSGCGESAAAPVRAPHVETASVSSAPSAAKTTLAPTASTQSLHARVMAEQGRGAGAAGEHRPTTTTSAANEPTTVTTSVGPPVEQDGPTSTVLAGGQTSLKGTWSGTAERLASYLLGVSPSPRFTVTASVLAEYYVRYCAEAGLRADLLWAQMIHETGYGMYGGDVMPEQNNYAGIGATGGGAPGLAFPTAEAGVMAQVAHMVAYVYPSSPVAWANATTDPRFDSVSPHGVASVLSDLDGRWAVPGTGYGESIETIARAINAD